MYTKKINLILISLFLAIFLVAGIQTSEAFNINKLVKIKVVEKNNQPQQHSHFDEHGRSTLPPEGAGTPEPVFVNVYVMENGEKKPLDYAHLYYGEYLEIKSEGGKEVIIGQSHKAGMTNKEGVVELRMPYGQPLYLVVWKSGYTSAMTTVNLPNPVDDMIVYPGGNKSIDFKN